MEYCNCPVPNPVKHDNGKDNYCTKCKHWYDSDIWFASRAEPIKRQHNQPRATKIGRNEPCPCGSGEKYKKCCLKLEGGK